MRDPTLRTKMIVIKNCQIFDIGTYKTYRKEKMQSPDKTYGKEKMQLFKILA